MIFGYARVSTDAQDHQLQLDALGKAGVDEIVTDTMSGKKRERPGLERMLDKVREGDVVAVWRLDRLGRSLKDLVEIVNIIKAKGAHFQSLNESIDTTTANGVFQFHLWAALAEFEASLIRERTIAGLVAAKAQGRVGGRPSSTTPEQKDMIRRLAESGEFTQVELCEQFGISRVTVHRILKEGAAL